MKKITLIILCACISAFAFAGDDSADKEAIKKVIQTAYVDGLQNNGDLAMTEKGFHPGFNLLGMNQNSLTKFPIYNWIQYAEHKKKENPEPPAKEELTTVKFLQIDITGTAAVAKIELYKNNKHIYTDYLSLYKFEEGWKIVNKIYYKIPDEE